MQGWAPDFIPKLTEDAVAAKLRRSDRAGRTAARRCGCRASSRSEEGIFSGISAARRSPARSQVAAGRAAGLDDPVHAARHRRALPEHAAVRRRSART